MSFNILSISPFKFDPSYSVSIEPLTPYISVPENPAEAIENNLSADLAEIDFEEDNKAANIPASIEDESDLTPQHLKEEAYRLLGDAFQFHRDHAWVIQSLIEREAAAELKVAVIADS